MLINAIKNANLPKFISDDVLLFERILDDIFPDSDPPSMDRVAIEVRPFIYLLQFAYCVLNV